MGKNNDEDVQENSSWSCPVCGAGGTCVKGDESMALAVHMTIHSK
jgi:hypothetical protein